MILNNEENKNQITLFCIKQFDRSPVFILDQQEKLISQIIINLTESTNLCYNVQTRLTYKQQAHQIKDKQACGTVQQFYGRAEKEFDAMAKRKERKAKNETK